MIFEFPHALAFDLLKTFERRLHSGQLLAERFPFVLELGHAAAFSRKRLLRCGKLRLDVGDDAAMLLASGRLAALLLPLLRLGTLLALLLRCGRAPQLGLQRFEPLPRLGFLRFVLLTLFAENGFATLPFFSEAGFELLPFLLKRVFAFAALGQNRRFAFAPGFLYESVALFALRFYDRVALFAFRLDVGLVLLPLFLNRRFAALPLREKLGEFATVVLLAFRLAPLAFGRFGDAPLLGNVGAVAPLEEFGFDFFSPRPFTGHFGANACGELFALGLKPSGLGLQTRVGLSGGGSQL
ncbi:MAG TPA: hypothetical protein VHK24_12595 [Steroidobacter sp.]|nr:hypothetical protein [Steroidobacter sp.]